MYAVIKALLFKFQPEKIHYWTMKQLSRLNANKLGRKFLLKNFSVTRTDLKVHLFGLEFPNPVGLAAGFDKDAKFLNELSSLGFGFIEIGTLTPKPQSGNEKPRLFRLPADKALINRMGFNNEGVKNASKRLKNRPKNLIIGGNIGKNKDTPNENAIHDYELCLRELYDDVDYFTINVSSPNTPNLRALQEKEPLTALLHHICKLNKQLGNPKPILLKIAPDLSHSQLDDIIDIFNETGIDGIIATNTTIDRSSLITSTDEVVALGAGGLSGAPLTKASTEIIRYLNEKSNRSIPIIAAGGIFNAKDAKEKLEAGAKLVQIYTGFIYEGPAIVKNICNGL